VVPVRVCGGNYKFRALRLDAGSFAWGTESITKSSRILDVVYNASSNELVRTKTLVKGCIVQVDAAPFRLFYEQRYGVQLGKKRKEDDKKKEEKKKDAKKKREIDPKVFEKRLKNHVIDPNVKEQFNGGRLLAAISTRPGQIGVADGYILEGEELVFYQKKLVKKK